jgi:hypothetical protein
MMRESAQVIAHTKGGMTGADVNNGSGEASWPDNHHV